ncbi:MAG TPA: protein translocase subunit SecF [Syntrophorhabdus sp.]|jgi:preprotein translocase subunit SecF|nr:MAG: preprotein translocase subunit SecF [Deltaproteobacteria bacterium ADurb.Bin135]HPB37681.1 protein translocase subunit SecF [Syntrophorhabdus sp.]HPW35450.1 protein translocase subunit SecF [Syntrophorhabdus sp.]HQB33570.1 protein translocase subunit SecF [Syntrophorhabdus sp.]HQG25430.1 protein translocase subunit SecF [Syntrophorhabdus sp.]
MFELLKDTKVDFIGFRKKAFIISAIMMIVGLYAFVMIVMGRANLSVDFTGGANLQIRFAEQVDIGALREVLTNGGISDVQIQEVSGTKDFFIKTKLSDIEKESIEDRVSSILTNQLPGKKFEILGSNMVGPGVGKDLRNYAIIAVCLAMLGIIGYIWYRFTLISGLAATIATFHDVVAVLGVFYLLDKEFNLLIITALLTIAGYSLSDTVVVFDRIRENMGSMKARDDLAQLMNRSINEVLSRTIITGISTMLALGALMLLGGEVLFDFSLALLIGLVVGTYSSIFIASPLVLIWRKAAK